MECSFTRQVYIWQPKMDPYSIRLCENGSELLIWKWIDPVMLAAMRTLLNQDVQVTWPSMHHLWSCRERGEWGCACGRILCEQDYTSRRLDNQSRAALEIFRTCRFQSWSRRDRGRKSGQSQCRLHWLCLWCIWCHDHAVPAPPVLLSRSAANITDQLVG